MLNTMKIWKLISVLLLACMVGACDDDPAGEELNGGASVNTAGQAKASFGLESKTVLKNAGEVLVPICLETAVDQTVKVTFSAQQSDENNIAREGVDFDIPEKVVTIAAGDTTGFLKVVLLDNGKAEEDRTVVLNMTGVYDGQVSGIKTCLLHIVNNAFVEFQYKNRETYEAAGSYKVPLLVTGDIKETTTFTVRVKEGGTALEGTHFKLPETSFTLEKGATSAEVEIELIDDTEANEDRWFDLEIVSVTGSNATVGRSIPVCRVTIISEEVFKSVAFSAASFTVEEGKTLRIPVALDKAPKSGEADVVVTFSVKIANSTAVEGEDFTITEKQLTFVAGQKEDELVIETIDNDLINADKVLELSIKAAAGANIGTPDICQVTILNNDLPAFQQAAYTVEEDYGNYILPVTLSNALSEDVTLKIKVVALENATEGKHYTLTTNEVAIQQGETSGNVELNIGYDQTWTGTPTFKVVVEEANGVTFDDNVCATEITLEQCTYRKMIGDWNFKIGSYDGNGKKEQNFVRNMTFEVKEWNKSFTVKTPWIIDWSSVEVTVTYDKATGNAEWGNSVPLYKNVGFGPGVDIYLRTAVQDDKYWSAYKAPMPLIWDSSTQTYTWDISASFGVRSDMRVKGTDEDGNSNGTWFIFKDLSMTKK